MRSSFRMTASCCAAPVSFALDGLKSSLKLDGKTLPKPYPGLLADGSTGQYYLLPCTRQESESAHRFLALTKGNTSAKLPEPYTIAKMQISSFLRVGICHQTNVKSVSVLSKRVPTPMWLAPPGCGMLLALRACARPKLTLTYGSVTRHILCCEGMVHGFWPEDTPDVTILSPNVCDIEPGQFFR